MADESITLTSVMVLWKYAYEKGHQIVCIEYVRFRDLPSGPVVNTPRFHYRGRGFHPGHGTKIPHATRRGQKKKNGLFCISFIPQ